MRRSIQQARGLFEELKSRATLLRIVLQQDDLVGFLKECQKHENFKQKRDPTTLFLELSDRIGRKNMQAYAKLIPPGALVEQSSLSTDDLSFSSIDPGWERRYLEFSELNPEIEFSSLQNPPPKEEQVMKELREVILLLMTDIAKVVSATDLALTRAVSETYVGENDIAALLWYVALWQKHI
jgi:hypothetical protein